MTVRFPGLTGIVLAAGLSRRTAPDNKLLLPFRGFTVVRWTVEAMADAGLSELLVVTGHQSSAVAGALAGLPVRLVQAEDFAEGMGRSLAAGVCQSSPNTKAWVVTPGDLPRITTALVEKIVAHASREGGHCHLIPTANGERGHPVVIGNWVRPRLLELRGDEGARSILASPAEAGRCRFLEVDDTAILRDVDTASAWSDLEGDVNGEP